MRYAIGDVHGNVETLKALFAAIMLNQNDVVYMLGDYIDRGPSSKQVIDVIMKLQEDGYNIVPLLGNHEDFMLQARIDRGIFSLWMNNGARQALNSYNKNWNADDWQTYIPHEHWKWLEKLPQIVVLEDYVLCHASLYWSGKDPITDSSSEDLLWSRDTYYKADLLGGRSLINGHTPTTMKEIEVETSCLRTEANRVIIDNGCFFKSNNQLKDLPGYGSLCCLNLDTKELYFQENED